MFDIEEAKLPPPKPDSKARIWKCQNGVSGLESAMPKPKAGNIKSVVVSQRVFLPPARRIKKVDGIRSVAPESPAIAAKVNNCDFSKPP